MKNIRLILALAIIAMMGIAKLNAQTAAATGDASATILQSISCSEEPGVSLFFGGIFSSDEPGAVTIDAAADPNRQATGGATLFAPIDGRAGLFAVSAPEGMAMTITLPDNSSVELENTFDDNLIVVIQNFTSSWAGGFTMPGPTAQLYIGGTLAVAANQEPGLYEGTFDIIIQQE